MISGQLTFYSEAAKCWYVLTVNGGHVTFRRADEKPYDADELPDDTRMAVLDALHKALSLTENAQ